MYKLYPVIFGTINKSSKFVLNCNNQRKYKTLGVSSLLSTRLYCVFKVHRYRYTNSAADRHIEFICVDEHHKRKSRRCCSDEGVLKLNRNDLLSTKAANSGNMLVRVWKSRCHSCGDGDVPCCYTLNGHVICNICALKQAQPPFNFGKTKDDCCQVNACGAGLTLYSESNISLYRSAVSIMNKRK